MRTLFNMALHRSLPDCLGNIGFDIGFHMLLQGLYGDVYIYTLYMYISHEQMCSYEVLTKFLHVGFMSCPRIIGFI